MSCEVVRNYNIHYFVLLRKSRAQNHSKVKDLRPLTGPRTPLALYLPSPSVEVYMYERYGRCKDTIWSPADLLSALHEGCSETAFPA